MDLAALRKREALMLEETLVRLRDGLADRGLRFLTAPEVTSDAVPGHAIAEL